eukprot:6188009-Pleurochrysis_carterae.AAC.2
MHVATGHACRYLALVPHPCTSHAHEHVPSPVVWSRETVRPRFTCTVSAMRLHLHGLRENAISEDRYRRAKANVGDVEVHGAAAAQPGREVGEVQVAHALTQPRGALGGQHVAQPWEGARAEQRTSSSCLRLGTQVETRLDVFDRVAQIDIHRHTRADSCL